MKKRNVTKKFGAVALCSTFVASAFLPLGSAYAAEYHQGDVIVEMNTKDMGEKVYVETLVRNQSDHKIDKVVIHRTSDTSTTQYDDVNIKKLTLGGTYNETCSDDSTKCQLVLTDIPSKDSHEMSKVIYTKKDLKKTPTFKYTVGTKEYTGGKFDDAQVSTIESLNGTPTSYTLTTTVDNSTKPADLQPKEEVKKQEPKKEVEQKPSTKKETKDKKEVVTKENIKKETKVVEDNKEQSMTVEQKDKKSDTVVESSQSNSTQPSKEDGALAKTNTDKKTAWYDWALYVIAAIAIPFLSYSVYKKNKAEKENNLEDDDLE